MFLNEIPDVVSSGSGEKTQAATPRAISSAANRARGANTGSGGGNRGRSATIEAAAAVLNNPRAGRKQLAAARKALDDINVTLGAAGRGSRGGRNRGRREIGGASL